MSTSLLEPLIKNWWILLIRGLCEVAFGGFALARPATTLVALIFLYGCFAGAEGVLEIVAAAKGGTFAPRWWLAAAGLMALIAAAVTFLAPGVTAVVLLYIIGGWAMAKGIFLIIGAISLRQHVENEWMLILGGSISALFGLCAFLWPGATALSLIWLIGICAVSIGGFFVALALRLKNLRST